MMLFLTALSYLIRQHCVLLAIWSLNTAMKLGSIQHHTGKI